MKTNLGVCSVFCGCGVAVSNCWIGLLFVNPKISGVLAVIDAALLFLTALLIRQDFFFTTTPPSCRHYR
jgi:hypothetical protein